MFKVKHIPKIIEEYIYIFVDCIRALFFSTFLKINYLKIFSKKDFIYLRLLELNFWSLSLWGYIFSIDFFVTTFFIHIVKFKFEFNI